MVNVSQSNRSKDIIASAETLLGKHPWIGVTLISLLYWASTIYLASGRILWLDEFFTLYDIRAKTFGEIWRFLMTGAEQTPPYFMMLTRVCIQVFGVSEVSLRLPAIIGFWMAMLCLYRIVSRCSSPIFGMIAMVFPMATPAYNYAAEARSYGLFLGFSALALMFWLEIDADSTRKWSWQVYALAASLILAGCCHFYAILLPIPLAIGELVLLREGVRPRWDVWLAFVAVIVPFPAAYPEVHNARLWLTTFWLKPQPYFGVTWFDLFLSGAPVVAALPFFTIKDSTKTKQRLRISPSGAAALTAFLALPFLCTFIALFTGAYMHRYGLPAILGAAALYALVLARVGGPKYRGVLAISILLFFGFDFAHRQIGASRVILTALEGCAEMIRDSRLPDMPVLFESEMAWERVHYYPKVFLKNETLFAIDPEHTVKSTAMMTKLFQIYRSVVPTGVTDLTSIALLKQFEVYVGSADEDHWVVPALVRSGWVLRVVAQREDGLLLLAERK